MGECPSQGGYRMRGGRADRGCDEATARLDNGNRRNRRVERAQAAPRIGGKTLQQRGAAPKTEAVAPTHVHQTEAAAAARPARRRLN